MKQSLGSLGIGLAIVLGLFWLMHWMIRPREHAPPEMRVVEAVEVVEVAPEEEGATEDVLEAAAEPPPPPAAPTLSRPDLPSLSLPAPATAPLDAGPITVPAISGASLGLAGSSLSGSGIFGGFAGRGGGSGSGAGGASTGAGYGTGQGFKGKPLVPLSTVRPQMPEWACKQGIRGWVEVVFRVMPTGRVAEVKLIDADPKGVFETAAIESVSHWIYQSHPKARMVKQRVQMNPEDCVYNWPQ